MKLVSKSSSSSNDIDLYLVRVRHFTAKEMYERSEQFYAWEASERLSLVFLCTALKHFAHWCDTKSLTKTLAWMKLEEHQSQPAAR